MAQNTDGRLSQDEQDAEYKVIERAAEILDKNLTDGRVYALVVFDEDEPKLRKYRTACMTNAEPVKAGVALYVTAIQIRDRAVAEGMDEVHTDGE